MRLITLLVIMSILLAIVGCSKNQSAAKISTRSPNLNSHGLQKLTPEQVEKNIQAVEANSTLPDSAKPNIIASIRAQGQP